MTPDPRNPLIAVLSNKTIFHLTVNRDGVVSLWDTADIALGQSEEAYLPMILTIVQEELIRQTQQRAIDKTAFRMILGEK